MKRKTKKQKGKTIDEMQSELLITPEKLLSKIKSEELANSLPKKEVELRGDGDEEKIKNMTEEEMADVVVDIKGSKFWIAYKKYILARMKIVESSLYTMDPYKQSTELARNQGIRMGLMDFEGYIISLEEHRKKKQAAE